MTDLPDGWEWSTLGELGHEIKGSVRPAPGEQVELYSVPAYATGCPETLDGAEIGSAKRPVETHDVLLCKINPRINRVWIVGPSNGIPMLASPEYLVLRTESPTLSAYLRWYLQSPTFRDWISLSVEGATGSHTRAKSGPILEQRVPVPPQPEQERIVAAIEEHLSRLDAAEAQLDAVERKLQRLDEIATSAALTSHAAGWTTLGEIAEVRGGVTKDAKRQSDPAFVEVPYLRVANVQRGRLDLTEVTHIRVDPKKAEQLRLKKGDLLLNEGGDRDKLGRGWVWEGQVDGCIHQNHVFRARLLTDDFNPYFVSLHANSWGRAWFEQHGRQTTNLASINLKTLKAFPVPAPSRAEQDAIVAEVLRVREGHARMSDTVRTAQRRIATLRRSILAAAFAGKLVPQDPDDEPAGALLERIRRERG